MVNFNAMIVSNYLLTNTRGVGEAKLWDV